MDQYKVLDARIAVRVSLEDETILRDAAERQGVKVSTYLRNAGVKQAIRENQAEETGPAPIFPKEFAQYFCTALATQIITGAVQVEGMEDTLDSLHATLMEKLGYS